MTFEELYSNYRGLVDKGNLNTANPMMALYMSGLGTAANQGLVTTDPATGLFTRTPGLDPSGYQFNASGDMPSVGSTPSNLQVSTTPATNPYAAQPLSPQQIQQGGQTITPTAPGQTSTGAPPANFGTPAYPQNTGDYQGGGPVQPASGPPVAPNFSLPEKSEDAFRYLSNYAVNNPIYGEIFNNANKGLTPEAYSAMRTEATSGLNDRYEQVAKQLRTNLLRQGAMGSSLPPDTGAIINSFGPLQSELANARSKATRDTVLADYNARVTNRTAAGDTMAKALGTSSTAISGLSGLESESTRNILLAALLGAGTSALTNPEILKSLGSLFNKIPGIGNLIPDSTKQQLDKLSGIKGFIDPLTGGLSKGALDMLAGLSDISSSAGALGVGTYTPGMTLPNAAAELAPQVSSTLTGGTSLASTTSTGSSAMAAIAPFLPVAAAAIPAYFTIKANQSHPVADTWVQQRQNPFDAAMIEANSIDSANKDQAKQILVRDYLGEMYKWASSGGSSGTDTRLSQVAAQALDTFRERYGEPEQYGVSIEIPTWGMRGMVPTKLSSGYYNNV